MPTAYPRLNLNAIRAKVRQLTAIESTNLVTDAHINNLINEELYKIITLADELEQVWGSSTVTEGGITYRIPGWRFDNTTSFPSGLPGNFHLTNGTDLPPWNTTGSAAYKAGYYDNALVYLAAARLLREQDDDSKRADTFKEKADEIVKLLIQQEYVGHNADMLMAFDSSSQYFYLRLYFKVLFLLKTPLMIDADYSLPLLEVQSGIYDSKSELYSKYKWPFAGNFEDFNPYADMFAYAAAARLAPRFGLSDAETASLVQDYTLREQAAVRQLLQQQSQTSGTDTVANLVSTVRTLTNCFTKDVSDTLIEQFINDEFTTLVYERDWSWLVTEIPLIFAPGMPYISISQSGLPYFNSLGNGDGTQPGIRRVLGINRILPVSYTGLTTQTSVVPLRESTNYNDYLSDGEYKYILKNASIVSRTDSISPPVHQIDKLDPLLAIHILPPPTEDIYLNVRVVLEPDSFDSYLQTFTSYADFQTFGPMAFPLQYVEPASKLHPRFAKYLAYKAAIRVLEFMENGNTKMIPHYQEQAEKIHDAMVKYYVLSNSTESFTMSQNADTPYKYLPFFRGI